MPQRLPKTARPVSFTATAGACRTVYVILVLHAGAPASALTFTPPHRTNNRSVDHADHHCHRSTNTNDNNDNSSSSSGKGSGWLSPVCLRRGREQQRGSSSLFARLRSDALFGKNDACGGGSSSSSSSSSNGGRGRGVEGEGGGASSSDAMKRSATAAVATGIFKEEGEPYVLEGVKNTRDLSSIEGYGIAPGRVFRTGHLSAATERDAKTLRDGTGLRTLVDLRSATELGKDELIHGDIYEGFVNVGGEREQHGDTGVWEGPAWDEAILAGKKQEAAIVGASSSSSSSTSSSPAGIVQEQEEDTGARRRYFVSLIDESIYKKGVFQRLRRRHKAAVMALAPATMVSRRCTQKARDIFMRKINEGGLVLLNELLLQYSGDGINRVLRLLASKERHPVALYCTAGKDRTGLVVALTLAVLGVPDRAIVDDYAKSDAAYKELADRDAMVGALSQQDLDPDTFLGAPPRVMEDVLRFIRVKYGSIDGYLDSIGFDAEWRERLRSALLTE